MIIESSGREGGLEGSSDRVFGLVFTAFFAVISVWPLIDGGANRLWGLIPSCIFFVLALIWPHALSRLNRIWMNIGLLLNNVVSPVALGIIFYLTILPVGLMIRILGKDPLRLKYAPSVQSYWIRREPPGPDPKTLDRQF